jgi:hypothetical protein
MGQRTAAHRAYASLQTPPHPAIPLLPACLYVQPLMPLMPRSASVRIAAGPPCASRQPPTGTPRSRALRTGTTTHRSAHPSAPSPRQLPEPGDGFRAVGQLLEDLMSTNPRALDARAAIGLKVSEKALLLDNPVVQAGAHCPSLGIAGPLADQLASRILGA